MKHANTQNMHLYVSDWAPNGTNDLLIVDPKTNQVVNYIEKATFGIDVCKAKPRERATAWDRDILSGHVSAEEYDPHTHTLLRRVSKDLLRRKFCVSPSDPRGEDLRMRLLAAGVDLGKR